MNTMELLRNAVTEFSERHNHIFEIFNHTERSWGGTPEADMPGCYILYSGDGSVLYIGKASKTRKTGHRLWSHFKYQAWSSSVVFVDIVAVDAAYVAPSLEEYLTERFPPRYDKRGQNRLPAN